MRLEVRVPLSYSVPGGPGRGITTSLTTTALVFEAPIDPSIGSRVDIQLELMGSSRRIEFGSKVSAVAPIEKRKERLISVGNFEMEPEDARSFAAWMLERAPLVSRARPAEAAAATVRSAIFEVAPDLSDVKVGWATRAAFARTWKEELVRNTIRVRGVQGSPPRGTTTRFTFLIPQGVPVQLLGKVTDTSPGEAEFALDVPTEMQLRLAGYAKG